MKRAQAAVVTAALLVSLMALVSKPALAMPLLKAGVGIADATWHVGTGSGQYADKNPNALGLATGDEVDPFFHGQSQTHSYGVQSRLSYRALVIEGTNGKRIALVKSDSYLAQDYLVRRAAQILDAKGTSGVHYDQIMLHVTHNHSSPYYMSPSWGVWLFQDMFDIRTFEYHARQMALAIERAAANMKPVRIGATKIQHTIYKGNIAGAGTADDGTPSGYPETKAGQTWDGRPGGGDYDVTVMRIDDVTDASKPSPLAVWVNHGQHPESNDAYDLISADYLGPLERDVERAVGAPLVFSQADVGSSEGPYYRGNNEVLSDGVVRAWAHVGHAQTERGAKYLADSIVQAWNDIGAGNAIVPMSSTNVPVDFYANGWVAGPISHPYPSVSNCRTESTVEANPGSPIIGLPDCQRPDGPYREFTGNQYPSSPELQMVWEELKRNGVPVPDHYDAPSHGAVQENYRIHLQAMRIGEILLASCSCEAQQDLIKNFESRADDITTPGNIYDGFDWPCTDNNNGTWRCRYNEDPGSFVTVSEYRYQHMRAQVHNDAKGWDLPSNAVAANSEPYDLSKIWGNFTKEELSGATGYKLPVGVGHAGDYNGYVVSYREYMSYDHYRKALTAYGPHTADYMVTRMVRMAGALKGGPDLWAPSGSDEMDAENTRVQKVNEVDEARQQSIAIALGKLSGAAYEQWTASLPNDAGPAAPLAQPADVERFHAATFTWRGGSNATDNPLVRVERKDANGDWQPFADQTGEVQTKVKFPVGAAGVANTYAGMQEWQWTANFEAFDAFPKTVIPGGQIPDGTYRFHVDGNIKQAGTPSEYHLDSNEFHVGPWTGISVQDARRESNGDVSFVVPKIAYPRTYSSPFRFVHDDGDTKLCKTCWFRPWASTSSVQSASVTVTRANGDVENIAAALSGGRWTAPAALQSGDSAVIARGGVVDEFGEINGSAVTVA